MSSFLYRLGQRAALHPFRVLAAWLLVGLAVFAAGSTWGGETEDSFTVPGVESQEAHDLLKDRFPAKAGVTGEVVFHAEDGTLADPARTGAVEQVLERIADDPGVAAVSNPFDARGPTVSADGRTAFATVEYEQDELEAVDFDRVDAAAETGRDAGLQVEITGAIATAGEEVEGNEMVGLAVAVVVLLIAFGSIVAAGVPIAAALLALGVGMTAITVFAGFVDVPTVSPMLATMIGLGVGIDYALFIVTRYRQNLAAGMGVADAAGRANATAGQAVVFAGATVVVAITGLQLSGLPAVAIMGYATAMVVAVSVIAAITLLPAFLGLAGDKINRLRVPFVHVAERDPARTVSGRWAHHVGRHPVRYAVLSTLGLVALALPVLALRVGMPDDGNAAEATTQRQAYDLLADGFGPGFNGPLHVVLTQDGGLAPEAVTSVREAIAADPGIAGVAEAQTNPAGDTAVVVAVPTSSPQDEATADTVERLRDSVLPPAIDGGEARAMIGGNTAGLVDVSQRITDRLPIFIAAVVGLSFLLLMVVFRSVVVPLKAALMNLLSIGAAYGVIVAVFQWGWGMGLVGLEETVPVNPFVPMIMFAVLFGLSMDYEVFLLSRVREEFLRHGDSHRSVVDGLGSTARVITSAAIIMVSVFLAFVGSAEVTLKMFGLGLATAVFVDATIVRMVLVPSTMSLLGRANWWLPGWLDRILPHLDLEADPELDPAGEPEPDEDEELEPIAA